MENNMISKCDECGSIFSSSLIERPCPFCHSILTYKQLEEKSNIISYFNTDFPKLNNPLDFIYPTIKSPNMKVKEIWNKNKYASNHFINIISIYKEVEDKLILVRLCITWDFNYSEVYGIFQNLDSCYLDNIILSNLTVGQEDYKIIVLTLPAKKENYEKFISLLNDGNRSLNLSNYFQLYNSINWNVTDDENNIKKTFYEYASINYLLHLFQLIKIPDLFEDDFDAKLININQLSMHPSITIWIPLMSLREFNEEQENKKNLYNEALKEDYYFFIENNINNYEDIFDYYSKLDEGAVAPVSVPLSAAAQRSTEVYNKLYDLGYNPSMNIYSRGQLTSLCPTFKLGEEIYFIECNNNIMHGINIFDSVEDMKESLEEIYNEDRNDSLFIEIHNIPSDVMKFNILNSKDNKDFLTRLLSLRDKYIEKDNYIYDNTVQDEYNYENSIINKFRKIELNSAVLFKYSNTNFKLRNVNWAGNKYGYIFIDEHDNVAAYIIAEDIQNDLNIYRDIPKNIIKEITDIEVISTFKNTDLDLEMIQLMNEKYKIDTIKVRNLDLKNKLELNADFKYLYNYRGVTIYKLNNISNLNESMVLNEALNAIKRKKIEELIYAVFDRLDTTGANTKKYKNLFKSMDDKKFDGWLRMFLSNIKKNFYLEVLPNKNAPKIKNAVDALNYLNVPTEEYLYYRHDGNKDDPIRTRYKVPILYINIRRLQQILSKKNTFSLDINKRNLKTGQVTAENKIA